jgi:hypothetical protein
MSPQLQQVLNQARQLSQQEQRQLFKQLFGEDCAESPLPTELEPEVEVQLEYVNGVLVVKSQGLMLSGDLVADMREERMRQVGGW